MIHGETRLVLKTLSVIFVEGCSNCVEGIFNANTGGQSPARFDQCIKHVEKVVNEQILGSDLDCAQWDVTMKNNASPKKACEVKNNNRIARKLIENAFSTLLLSITDEESKVNHDA